MREYVDFRSVDVAVDVVVKVRAEIEAGLWVVREDDGRDYAVTHLQGLVLAGGVHLAYPRGVTRRSNGAWGAREYLLARAIPVMTPEQGWAAVPAGIREVVADSYALARAELPAEIGGQP